MRGRSDIIMETRLGEEKVRGGRGVGRGGRRGRRINMASIYRGDDGTYIILTATAIIDSIIVSLI